MASLFEKLAASRPVNRAAASSFSYGEQVFHEPKLLNVWDVCPPLQYSKRLPSPEFIDFTGRRFGSLRVVGMALTKSKKGVLWVCRCDCGKFCGQLTATLKKLDKTAQCSKCNKLEFQANNGPSAFGHAKKARQMVSKGADAPTMEFGSP